MSGKPGAKPLTVAELEKAKALSAFGKSYRQIGLELNRSDKTIKKALTKTPEVIAEVRELKEDLADWYEDLSRRMLKSITDIDIQKISAYQRTLSAAVSTDKMRLLRDQSTQNISMSARIQELDKSIAESDQRIAELAQELGISISEIENSV